jgi:enoyl-CoA hydratase
MAPGKMNDIILTDTSESVTTVTLNRPESLNALNADLKRAIARTFIELRHHEDTRVIILTGAGRAFCAGLDLKELGQHGMNHGGPAPDLHAAITEVGKPIIGAINGFAITGGFEIALMCDILIASANARFADTHVRMGVVPGWGLSQRLSKLIGSSRAKEMSFTGNYVDAGTAFQWGLVNKVLAPEELLEHCHQLARDICSAEPLTLAEVHRLIDFGNEHTLAEGLAAERRATSAHREVGDLSAGTLEQRRGVVQTRGRAQAKDQPTGNG